jgi:tripartite-type tricarboxylate transporter receptor subunit TctC
MHARVFAGLACAFLAAAHAQAQGVANAVSPVKDGRLVGLGVTSPERDPLLPDMPTVAEAGVPGYKTELWFGLLTKVAQASNIRAD